MTPLILLLLGVSGVICESHSLSYYYTGMSQSGILKEFQAMTYFDDQEIMSCNQKKIMCHPVVSWMKDKEDDIYWENKHTSFKSWEKAFKENLLLLKQWFNNTNGLLILQLWYGCEIHNDGDIKVHYQYGFQGRDYELLDTFKLAWDPITHYVLLTDAIMNEARNIKESVKSYLDGICPYRLSKYIGYGKEKLEWKDPPKGHIVPVKVTERMIKLQCLVYGFHPRAVHVKWVRNGVDNVPSEEISPILPHPDGTYQIRVSMEMPKREEDTYACHVDHSSLKEEIVILWDPKKGNVLEWIIYSIPVFVLLVATLLFKYCHQQAKEASGVSQPLSKDVRSSNTDEQQTFQLHCKDSLSVVGDISSRASIILYESKTKQVITC